MLCSGRFNERLVLSLASNPACILMDDELNILPTSSHVANIKPLPRDDNGAPSTVTGGELDQFNTPIKDHKDHPLHHARQIERWQHASARVRLSPLCQVDHVHNCTAAVAEGRHCRGAGAPILPAAGTQAKAELADLVASLSDTQPVGPLVARCRTLDQVTQRINK